MEQRDFTRMARPKGNEEFFSTVTTINRADLSEVGLLASPMKSLPLPGEQQDHEEDEDLGLGKDVDAASNADSERWSQGDGLEDQEFSIKEANFSEGSLKLKIQTTKRTKKPPKNLENYICPPEIRITIKQPGDQKTTKHGKNSRGAKEEDKGPPRKRTYERTYKRVGKTDDLIMDGLRESTKPKHESKSNDIHHLDWTKSSDTVGDLASQEQHRTEPESKREMASIHKSPLSEPNIPFSKTQVKKVTEGLSGSLFASAMSSPGADSLASSPADIAMIPPTDSSVLTHSSFSKDRCLQEVTEQVFGNIKRKYGRKDPVKAKTENTLNLDIQWAKKIKRDTEIQDSTKDKQPYNSDKGEFQKEEPDKLSNKADDENKILSSGGIHHSNDSKTRKRRNRKTAEDKNLLDDPPTTHQVEKTDKADQGSTKPKMTNNIEFSAPKQFGVNIWETEEDSAGTMTDDVEIFKDRQRKIPAGRPRSMIDPDKQTEARQSKVKDRWSYLKSQNSAPHKDVNQSLSIEEPPSAFPITPSSPLYTNTNSLTVITPVKKKRGRPKKQPLLTVETIHEGTTTSPVSPIAQDSSSTSKRKKKQNMSKLVQLALNNSPSPAQQLKLKKSGQEGVLKKRATKKMKLVKMQSILNELLSTSSSGNLALKSNVLFSNAMSTVASTIEARYGKQINVSKRGTIYTGKRRGRKPRADQQAQQNEHKASDKHLLPISSPFENPLVPSNTSSATGMPSPRVMHSFSAHSAAGGMSHPATTDTSQHDLKTMPNLQPISALPSKTHKGLLGSNWKLSPPRLMANSPSHLSEVASIKEVTLSPVSESHSEETIPSDSGIGTDNNSTSDQAEKGPASRRRYSFDLCSFDATEAAVLEAKSKAARGHYQKRTTAVAVENCFAQESLKKQKHRRKRKALQNRDDLQFIADLEELVSKFQVFRISHRSCKYYQENSYPSIFRLNFDHYYPIPYYPYDPVHYLRRSSEKSKRRRGRPAKSNEPLSKMPFIQGFGCPVLGGSYYAPYTMPYTSMPLATSMINMGYYGQYHSPLYLSHALGPSGSPLMRPPVPPPKFHPGASSSLAATSRHRAKSMPHEMPSSRMSDSHHPLRSCLSSVCLHKRKHKPKHKHKEDQYIPPMEELGGLFSGTQSPAFLSLLNERLEKNSLSKLKDKPRGKQSTDASPQASKNFFEVDTLSSLSLSDSQHCKRTRGETLNNFLNICTRQPHERLRASQDQSLDLFKGQHLGDDDSIVNKRRHSLEDFASFREESMASFQRGRDERAEQMYQCPNAAVAESSSFKRRRKHNEVEEIQCDMQAFSKIITTKKNLDHVNKILKVKRLQRQAKTGNNIVKRRRGRPRKQPISLEEGLPGQMPVLEKCVDLPGKRNLHTGLVPAQLEFSNHDSITDAIESVVNMARSQPSPQSTQGGTQWHKVQPELQIERPNRKGRGNRSVDANLASHFRGSNSAL
ncbi:SET-binding protein-like [Myxocyprinus asiaticus]|uniref:SET-binding protein-like n=1 Tax=Myxocyprinus asiaticus TaxID=70543 RepID=UPI00222233EA|nr:SET-binding protein-like [Myxocyprinus asiaticus]XP_051536954.1 SET-binding protein-like [Myxocyprinus asiaticus]